MERRTEVLRIDGPGARSRAIQALRAGGVVILPTETLYGLSCRADDATALERIARIKRMPRAREFVALVDGLARIVPRLSPRQDPRSLDWLQRIWPAPLSGVLALRAPAAWGRPRAGDVDAALRVPASLWLCALLAEVGEPVVSTSANRSGEPPLAAIPDLVRELGREVDLIVEDPELAGAGLPSTLVDATAWPPRLLRAGSWDASDLPGRDMEPAGPG